MTLGLIAGPLAHAIGWALLHLLWQGAVVAAALAGVLRLLSTRSANVRYTLCCGALALIVVLGVVTAVREYSVGATSAAPAPVVLTIAPVHAAAVAAPARAWPARLGAWNRVANDWLPRIVALWLAGVAICSVRLILEWLRVRRMATGLAVPARAHWQAASKRLAAALGVRRVVRLLESAAVEVPSVIGLVRPAILLPASALTGLTPEQLEMILAHELAHIRRHDFLVNLVQAVVETLLFYHPGVWWISHQVRIERENCCDDLAVSVCGTPLQYARALTRLEELRAGQLAIAVSANGGSLRERILRIAGRRTRLDGRFSRGAAALVVLPIALLVIAAPSFPAIGAWERSFSEHAASRAHRVSTSAVTDAVTAIASDVLTETPPADAHGEAAEAAPESAESGTAESGTDPESTDSDRDDAGARADGVPALDDLIRLGSQGVTADDVRAFRAVYPHASLSEIANLATLGATPDFVRGMRSSGIELESPRDAAGMAALGVTPEYVRGIRDAGLHVSSAAEVQGLAALGVTPEDLRGLRAAGLGVTTASEAQGLAAVGVTPEFVRALRDAGVRVTSAREAQGLAALGVTPEFVQRLARAGYRNLSVDELSRLAAAGVSDDFIRDMSQYRSR